MTDRCEIPGCGHHEAITYLGYGVCSDHYDAMTKNELERALGIDRGQTTEGVPMSETDKVQTNTNAPAETAGQEEPMPKYEKTNKKGRPKGTGKTAAKTPSTIVAKKAEEPPHEKKAPRTDLRTIATRVPQATFTLLHDAASAREMKLGPWMESTLEAAARKILS